MGILINSGNNLDRNTSQWYKVSMTKRVNRKYFVCVEDDGVTYTHKFTKGYSCGSYYYSLSRDGNGMVINEEDIESSIIEDLNHARWAQNSLIRYYKKKLPKGERPKVFLKRIYEKDMGMLK